MKIAIDLSGVDEHTGVRVYAAQLVRELQQADTDHEFIVIMRRRDLSLYTLHRREFNAVFIPRAAEGALANIAWHWTSYRNLLQEHCIDLVHQLDCNRVSLLRGYAHVVTVHGLIDSRVPARRHFVRQQYNAVLVPRLLHLATHVISVSSNTRRDLLGCTRVPDERITVIHEGCSLASADDMTESAARALLQTHYGIRSHFILYVARLEHPNKNHISLLKAYELLSRHNASLPDLVFVGGDSYRADVVKQAVNSFSLKERVTLTGFIPDKHLRAFYRCALAYACPTLYEGFGLPLLEAMQYGVPIVCSDSSSLPEVVGDAAVQFRPHDVLSIAAALDSLLSNAALRGRLIEQGRKQLEKFSGKAMAEKTLQGGVVSGTAILGAMPILCAIKKCPETFKDDPGVRFDDLFSTLVRNIVEQHPRRQQGSRVVALASSDHGGWQRVRAAPRFVLRMSSVTTHCLLYAVLKLGCPQLIARDGKRAPR